MSTIDEIKSRIDIVDLVSEAGVRLRHAGKNYTGFCPFHENKKTPAFVVWPESGTWRCFGQCNEGGDVFKFVMKRENLEFKDALEKLAARAGVELPTFSRESPQQKEAYEHLRRLLEDAVIFYRSHLLAHKEILDYLRTKRGLTDASIETFGLGYAPRSWDAALTHFTQRGYSVKDMLDAGLISQRDSGGHYDRFRNRIMIPIRDATRRMAGFGARIVDPDDVPKFLNSPETVLFTKGHLLYGLDRAHKAIRATDQAVIVEGYLDVIALHQAGYENVVSPMGTALTEDQLRLLKKFTRRIVLALDPDTAGQKAILRGLDAARAAMDREGEFDFDPRGLLRNEARLQADLRVASLPDDLDPDEIVARNRDEWAQIIDSAKPIVEHVMISLGQGRDLKDHGVVNEIAGQVLPLIQDLPSPADREFFTQRLARYLRVDERAFIGVQAPRQQVKQPRQVPQKQVVAKQKPVVTVSSSKMVEEYIVGVLFRKPELVFRLDRLLQQFDLLPLTVQDFEYTDHQMMFRLIRESVEQDKTEHHDFVVGAVPETLQGLSRDLFAQTEKMERLEEKLLEELLRGVIKLRRVAAGENLNQLRFLQEEAHQSGDLRASSYQDLVLQNTKLLRDLDQASRRMSLRKLE
ncbi:MAG TPA: DNA primase [Anaerolineales bacterium]|nr:DNA primase [Anaerolineales bacterium]